MVLSDPSVPLSSKNPLLYHLKGFTHSDIGNNGNQSIITGQKGAKQASMMTRMHCQKEEQVWRVTGGRTGGSSVGLHDSC